MGHLVSEEQYHLEWWRLQSSVHGLLHHLEEYEKLHPHKVKIGCRPVSHWTNPPSGRLKINFDGAFCSDKGKGGLGVVVRNEDGKCIAALQGSLPFVSSALHAKAEACRDGLLWAIQQGWDDVILEMDCSVLMTALDTPDLDLASQILVVLLVIARST